MYEKAAKIFANELYDELLNSDILESKNIWGGITENLTFDSTPRRDKNYFLWAIIPYITALSGLNICNNEVSFEEAATVRPDGGQNICWALVNSARSAPPKYFNSMKQWRGPSLISGESLSLWQIDSEWSDKRIDEDFRFQAQRSLSILNHWWPDEVILTKEELAYLTERGILMSIGEPEKELKVGFQCVCLADSEAKNKLIAIGDKIKEKHFAEFEELKKPYIEAVLKETPKHLYKAQKYVLQYLFYDKGRFILHCLKELVNNGKLKLPTEEEKRSLSMIIIHE